MRPAFYSEQKHNEYKYLIFFLLIIVSLPVMILRDFTPANELRYLSIADEAIRNHQVFAFTNHSIPYADKPPLYFWIVMGCRWIAGGHYMWLLSLFSILPAIGIAAVMDSWTKKSLSPDWRCGAMVMLLTSAYYLGSALTLRMDMLMAFFIVLALRSIWRIHQDADSPSREKWLLPVWLFLAVFTKGPLGLLIPLCATAVYLLSIGRIRDFGKSWGWRCWLVLFLLCGSWFLGVYLDGGREYLDNLLFHQTMDRAVNSFHHNKPVWYYCMAIWYVLAPWSLIVVGVSAASLFRYFNKTRLQLYFLSIAWTTFVLLSLISGKLEIYTLPALPFFVYSAVMAFDQCRKIWLRIGLLIPALPLSTVIFGVIIAAPRAKEMYPFLSDPRSYIAAAALSLGAVAAVVMLVKKRADILRAIYFMAGGMAAAIFAGGLLLSELKDMTGYGNVVGKAIELSEEFNVSDIRTWKLNRAENIDVYLGREVTVLPENEVPEVQVSGKYILITKQHCESDIMLLHGKDVDTVARTPEYSVIVFSPRSQR